MTLVLECEVRGGEKTVGDWILAEGDGVVARYNEWKTGETVGNAESWSEVDDMACSVEIAPCRRVGHLQPDKTAE